MFEVRFKSGLQFKRLVDSIKDLFKNSKWLCTQRGITLMAIDESKTIFVKLDIFREAFDQFRSDRDITFGLQTKCLAKILKYVTIEDRIRLRADGIRNKVHVFVEPIEPNAEFDFTEYTIQLMDVDVEDWDQIPEFPKITSIWMPSTKLQRICHDLSQVGDTITVCCTEIGIKFFVRGDNGTGCVNLTPYTSPTAPLLDVKLDCNEPITQTFRLKALSQFTKATPNADQVLINMRADGPLEVIYNTIEPKVVENRVYLLTTSSVKFYMAQNVDNEE